MECSSFKRLPHEREVPVQGRTEGCGSTRERVSPLYHRVSQFHSQFFPTRSLPFWTREDSTTRRASIPLLIGSTFLYQQGPSSFIRALVCWFVRCLLAAWVDTVRFKRKVVLFFATHLCCQEKWSMYICLRRAFFFFDALTGPDWWSVLY